MDADGERDSSRSTTRPAYLPAKLDSLLALDWPADPLEVLDVLRTARRTTPAPSRATTQARDPRVRLIVGERRRGKPTAVNTMRLLALGEVLLS